MRSNDQLCITFQEEEIPTASGVEILSEAARSATREVIRVSGEPNKSPDPDPSQTVRNSVNDQHRAPCLPRYDSPTDKLLMRGAEALSDVELLSLFMGENTELARKAILFNFQSLRELFQASEKDFQVLGIRQQSYVQLQAVLTLSQRWLKERLERGDVLSDVSLVRDFLSAKLRDQPAEQFCVLFLDNRHRVIAFEPMFQGTIDQASVHPREVVKRALHHNAAATILAHNHPSGVAEPSQADHRITDRLKDALGLIDVRVLDHFVVGDELISFAQRGYL